MFAEVVVEWPLFDPMTQFWHFQLVHAAAKFFG